ncbi:MAG: hypothetical protein IT330_04265 [Anaerolineae bacterium]|nr:hypothetical protein [Anaerolineae bacterium]
MGKNVDILERVSRVLTLTVFVIAFVLSLVAPVLAISWIRIPFPGFVIEQTLIVNDRGGVAWSGRLAGLAAPQRVTRIAGIPVRTSAEFRAALSTHAVGEPISVFVTLPDGTARLYRSIVLSDFSAKDMVQLFWLPYLVGWAYLAIGLWIYRLRGHTRPGRALAFFCACTTVLCVLLFDVLTTHVGMVLWLAAVSQLGGAVISMALRFPEEWKPVERRPWILGVPYLVSTALMVWNVFALYDTTNPWALLTARGASYRYAAFACAVFLGTMFYRARMSESAVVRQQARLVLLGSAIAFVPVGSWLAAPLFGIHTAFNNALFLPVLFVFPISVGIAILRYRLLEVDFIINRTFVYGTLTAILAGVFTVSITISQKLFVAMTGERSDAAIVLTTLIIVSVFTPFRTRVQKFFDVRFKELPDSTRALRHFGDQVRSFIQMYEAEELSRRLLEEAVQSVGAKSGALSLAEDGRLKTIHTYGHWNGEAWLAVPIEWDGQRYGLLSLGPCRDRRQYTQQEYTTLKQVVGHVAHAIHLTREPGSLPASEHESVIGRRGAVAHTTLSIRRGGMRGEAQRTRETAP